MIWAGPTMERDNTNRQVSISSWRAKKVKKRIVVSFLSGVILRLSIRKGNDAISWGETARLLEKAIFIDGYKEFYYTHLVVVYLASDRMAKAGEYMERYNRLTERKDRNHYRFLQLLLNVLYYSPDIKECRECFVRSNENN